MRTIIRVPTLILISSFLVSACSSQVVPEKGPTMEQVYDGMRDQKSAPDAPYLPPPAKVVATAASASGSSFPVEEKNSFVSSLPKSSVAYEFRKLPNPELKLYIFPHLAGKDDVPIPGYFTVFNAYTRDHYALPNETIRE